MAKNNISKLFYKDYYLGVDFGYIFGGEASDDSKKAIKEINKKIKSAELINIDQEWRAENEEYPFETFELEVCYPGLVTGTGLVHGSKNLEGAFNLGMHFDYTTGMPVIYGSSVKGVLRSYFNDFCSEEGVKEKEVESLEKEIFEGKKDDGSMIPIYKRDVFFDAVVVRPGGKKRLLEDDSITPHTGGPLKNPIPIAMLKIAPGCKIKFRFVLHDSEINECYTRKKKAGLFEKILKTVGIGAKTNVGYGQFA